jgi:hypothetical protein
MGHALAKQTEVNAKILNEELDKNENYWFCNEHRLNNQSIHY